MKKMQVGVGLFLILSVLFVTVILSGCREGSVTEEMPEVKWQLATSEVTHNFHIVADVDKFAERVSARTGGKFDIRVALEGELGFNREAILGVLQKGEIDMGFLDPGWAAAQVPHLGVFGLTFLQDGTLAQTLKLEQATRELTLQEFRKLGIGVIAYLPTTPQEIISSKEIPDFTDLNGQKIRVWRDLDAKLIERMKGVPVSLPAAECYTAMQRGVVSAVNTGTPAMVDRSLQEVGKYLYRFGGPPGSIYIAYNIESFNALPSEYKRIFWEEAWRLNDQGKETVSRADGEAVAKLKAAGVQEFQIPPDQRAKLQEIAKPLWNEWASQNPLNKIALDTAMKALGIQ